MNADAGASDASGLRLAAGGRHGSYYTFGKALARHVARSAALDIEVQESDGAKANVDALEEGTVDFAFCQDDIMAYAFAGERLFGGEPRESFSVVAALYDETLQVVARDPSVRTVADLEGRRLGFGAPGSGTAVNALDVLGAYGLQESDVTPAYLTFGDAVGALESGLVDAAFVMAGMPVDGIADLASSGQAHIVRLDDRHIKALLDISPHYRKAVIPANTYANQPGALATVAVGAVVLASDSVAEDVAYRFTSDLFDSAADPAVASSHARYSDLSTQRGASIQGVPYHPGAARYFAEKGFEVAVKRS